MYPHIFRGPHDPFPVLESNATVVPPSSKTVQKFFSDLESHVPSDLRVSPSVNHRRNFTKRLRLSYTAPRHPSVNRSSEGEALLFSIIRLFRLFWSPPLNLDRNFFKKKHAENSSIVLFPISAISDEFCFRFLAYFYECIRARKIGFPVYAREHFDLFSKCFEDLAFKHRALIQSDPHSSEATHAKKWLAADELHLKKLFLEETVINTRVSSEIRSGVYHSRLSPLQLRYFVFDLEAFNFHYSSKLEYSNLDGSELHGEQKSHAEVFCLYTVFVAPCGKYRDWAGLVFHVFDGPNGMRTIEQVLQEGKGGLLLFTCHIALKRTDSGNCIRHLNYSVFTE